MRLHTAAALIARTARAGVAPSYEFYDLAVSRAARGGPAAMPRSTIPQTLGDIVRHIRGDTAISPPAASATRVVNSTPVECCMSGCAHCVLDQYRDKDRPSADTMERIGMTAFEELERRLRQGEKT